MATLGGAGDASTTLSPGPPPPRPRMALRAVRCCRGGGDGTCHCPWDAEPTSPGHRDAHGGLAGLQFGLVLQGCGCRGLLGCSMFPQGTPWPQQPCLCHGWGFPRTLTCLFCFAVLGWSRRGALGQLSPPTPSLLPPDQVGPWAAVPCPPATLAPRGWASQHRCRHRCGVGCCLAGSGPAPEHCNAAGLMLSHRYRSKP